MPPFVASPVDPRLFALLAEAGLGDVLFNAHQHRGCELVEHYVLQLAIDLVGGLQLEELLRTPRSVDELLAARGFVPRFAPALGWLLARLALAGLVAREADGRYRLAGPLPTPDLDAVRAEGLAADASYAPVFALLDEAAVLYPRVARGETDGESALFRRLPLWFAYFSNQNNYYALNNRVTARVAADRFPGGRVLEVGAGLGSASEALLDVLAARDALATLAAYRATEPVPLFRRRAERTLRAAYPGVPLDFAALDLNQSWAAQGIDPGSVQLVWGVNVFHLARDLDAVLAEARAALAPGGWLVVGEGLRPRRGEPVGAEFPFRLLTRFTDVVLDPTTRSTAGFLTADEWLGALARAGFPAAEIVPDPVRLRPYYTGMLAAAACGRRLR
jgi:SAM-dependent methyltransferase